MAQYGFGAGNMYGILPGTPPTPMRFGTLQEVTIDFSANIKELFGQNKFSDVVAQGQTKVTGKAKFGRINAKTYNNLFFNQAMSTGMTLVAQDEMVTIPAADPYSAIVANGATFQQDLGVIYAVTGQSLICVAAAPATGQYSVNPATGAYTFAAADTGQKVYISYTYTSDTTGSTITLNNQLIGQAPTWQGIFNGKFSGKQVTMILNACVSNKLSLISTKVEDFMVPELDFSASCDAGGVLGYLSTHE